MFLAFRTPLITLVLLFALLAPGLSRQLPSVQSDDAETGLRARTSRPFLRIMPLGASLTFGYKSPNENGYRIWLRRQLRYAGWEVDMVGSKKIGTMKDNENEGHFAYRVDQIADAVQKSLSLQPNLILLNAGTNDALQSYHIDTAGQRIDALLTDLFTAINGTTVVLSTLIPNTEQPDNVKEINRQYRDVAANRRAVGDRVVLAEMSDFVEERLLVDGIHPSEYGYKEMASVWWAAIQLAEQEGMLQEPNGGTGTVNAAVVSNLDDGTDDPKLPDYTAPSPPELTSGSCRVEPPWICLVMATLMAVGQQVGRW